MTVIPLPDEIGAPPTPEDLRAYLTITSSTTEVDDLLQTACDVASRYEFGRCSSSLMEAAGFTPPDVIPVDLAQAMLMRAAAFFRRRNSVNGFEGFADFGAFPIRAGDPDIERLVDPWRAWSYA